MRLMAKCLGAVVLLCLVMGCHKKPGPDGRSLLDAAIKRDWSQVRSLIENGADVNVRDPDTGYTALHLAAGAGNMEIVKFLVAKGADVNAANEGGWTPLHCAIAPGRRDLVQWLIANGADVNKSVDGGQRLWRSQPTAGPKRSLNYFLRKGQKPLIHPIPPTHHYMPRPSTLTKPQSNYS